MSLAFPQEHLFVTHTPHSHSNTGFIRTLTTTLNERTDRVSLITTGAFVLTIKPLHTKHLNAHHTFTRIKVESE